MLEMESIFLQISLVLLDLGSHTYLPLGAWDVLNSCIERLIWYSPFHLCVWIQWILRVILAAIDKE